VINRVTLIKRERERKRLRLEYIKYQMKVWEVPLDPRAPFNRPFMHVTKLQIPLNEAYTSIILNKVP
jgi:hypothetical protein